MLPIANKPMLMYGFDQIRAAGIKEIGVILGPLQEGIVDALGDGSRRRTESGARALRERIRPRGSQALRPKGEERAGGSRGHPARR